MTSVSTWAVRLVCHSQVNSLSGVTNPSRADVACRCGPLSRRKTLRYALGVGAFVGGWRFRGDRQSAMGAVQSPIEKVLEDPKWPQEFPLKSSDFGRYDENPDELFYSQPRFVTHIDDGAINALTQYYASVFPPSGQKDTAILDLCSSWISHYPKGYKAGKISGLGMNAEELQRNPVLTDWTVSDLNRDPQLPFEDTTFDVITNAVSVDYLSQPLQVFREMHRVLKPGGLAIMSFSNRCFPTKAISAWTASGDSEHVWIVGSYFHYSVNGGFEEPKCKDISPQKGWFGAGDPMYVVYARKKS